MTVASRNGPILDTFGMVKRYILGVPLNLLPSLCYHFLVVDKDEKPIPPLESPEKPSPPREGNLP